MKKVFIALAVLVLLYLALPLLVGAFAFLYGLVALFVCD